MAAHGTRAKGYSPAEKAVFKADKVSRQRLWQIKMRKEGRCVNCGAENNGPYAERCQPCQDKLREKTRKPGHKPWQPGSRGRKPFWAK